MKHLAKQLKIIFVLPFLIVACSLNAKEKIQLLSPQQELQREVNHFIQIGMPIQNARKIMEDSNFSCTDYKKDLFAIEKRDEYGHPIGKSTTIEGDFLWCSVTHSYFIASKSWQVFLLSKNNKVSLVYAVINYQNL